MTNASNSIHDLNSQYIFKTKLNVGDICLKLQLIKGPCGGMTRSVRNK